MKMKILICLVSLLIGLSACGGLGEKAENSDSDNKAENAATAEKKDEGEKKDEEEEKEFTGELEFPFDFPKAGTTAKSGEKVFAPSYNWLVDAMQKDPKTVMMSWYKQEMVEPGEEMSEIKYIGNETKKVPNAYIVSIPAGQTAKKGDILLASWGASMNRAIVTNAADPKAPTVRYLDIDYDNPAKSSDGKTTIGQMEEQLELDTFMVIKNELEPGTSVAIGSEMKHGQVIRVEEDRVFVSLFAGRVDVFPKSDVKAIPIKPNVKAGDKVKAVWVGKFIDGTVSKVDENIGRVWVKFDSPSKEEVVAFGDVLPN